MQSARALSRSANGSAQSWRFAPLATKGAVVFRSAPGKLALAREAGLRNVSELQGDDGKGYALYRIELSRTADQ